MPTIQLKMTDESYDELKQLAQKMGESSVAALVRTGIGVLSYLHRYVDKGFEIILHNVESEDKYILSFPLKKGV